MKLELKHLSPYLPFELEIQVAGENVDDDPEGLPRIFTMAGIVDGEVIRNNKGYISNVEEEIEDVFPILRPLSDLSSLGDDKIQINEHTINKILGYGDVEFSSYKGDLDFIHEGDPDQRYDSSKTISFNTFEMARTELLKGHFDIFGLIEKGLAIDINTIKK